MRYLKRQKKQPALINIEWLDLMVFDLASIFSTNLL